MSLSHRANPQLQGGLPICADMITVTHAVVGNRPNRSWVWDFKGVKSWVKPASTLFQTPSQTLLHREARAIVKTYLPNNFNHRRDDSFLTNTADFNMPRCLSLYFGWHKEKPLFAATTHNKREAIVFGSRRFFTLQLRHKNALLIFWYELSPLKDSKVWLRRWTRKWTDLCSIKTEAAGTHIMFGHFLKPDEVIFWDITDEHYISLRQELAGRGFMTRVRSVTAMPDDIRQILYSSLFFG